MFTLAQIKAAHAQVKSGADFPKYIQDIIQLGVTGYETYVSDGHSLFLGKNDYKIESPAKYAALKITNECNAPQFQKALKEHQEGKTDYPTFCRISASAGVEKWVVDMAKMTCTYYDKRGNEMLVETIPTPI